MSDVFPSEILRELKARDGTKVLLSDGVSGGKKAVSVNPNQITTVCCVCGVHLRGPWPATRGLSHGICQQHFRQAMREIGEYLQRQNPQRLDETPAESPLTPVLN